jgi:undecaprenyl pyrophosphate synthase
MVVSAVFRATQTCAHVAKMLYWQVFVLFLSVALALGHAAARPRLNKVPTRVALCVELPPRAGAREREALTRRCAEASAWCLDAGVDDVTIFESSGFMEGAGARELFCKAVASAVTRQQRGLPRLVFGQLGRVRNVRVFAHGEEHPCAEVRCAAAEEATEDVCVRFLAEEDGNSDVARVARQLVDDRDIGAERITERLLDQRLSGSRGSKDKLQLVITYSCSPTLLGFPGWLTRTPEILNVGEGITQAPYAAFVWALFKYSKTEQRWGS